MKIEIKKIGNSTGVILPKELLTKLRLKLGDTLFVTETADGGLKLVPHDPAFEQGLEIARKAMRTYKNALRELAK
jgi:putative addiction module antidote